MSLTPDQLHNIASFIEALEGAQQKYDVVISEAEFVVDVLNEGGGDSRVVLQFDGEGAGGLRG